MTVTGLTGEAYTSMHVDAPTAPEPTQDFPLDQKGPRPPQHG
ncbi:hypothetical protein ACFRCG_38000 [Embleya sp. NPDC056575]